MDTTGDIKMRVKDINRCDIVEHKQRERHKKAIDDGIKNITAQEMTNGSVKKKTVKKNAEHKNVKKDKQKIMVEDAVNNAHKGKASAENLPGEDQVVISKEERAERFKRLNAIAQNITNKWNNP